MHRLARILVWSVVILLTTTAGAVAGLVMAYLKDLPPLDPLEEYRPSLVTTIYSDRDEPFGAFFEQKRILVPLRRIPPRLIQAVIAVEDARFYRHRGVDPKGILRAFLANLRAGRPVEGASTITQQLAKVLFLTPEKSLARKIKEALLALAIERHYTKDKILELYFNQIYFGQGAYGVEAAAQTYFRKSVDHLTLAEMAMLAGLPRAPNTYSPVTNPDRARRRRDHVLARMVEQGFITREEARAASRTVFDESLAARTGNVAPYFVEYVRQYLEEEYGTYAVYHGGLRVYTTLNLAMQRAAEEALLNGLRDIDKARGYRPPPRRPPEAGPPPARPPRPGDRIWGVVRRVTPRGVEVELGAFHGQISPEGMAWAKVAEPSRPFTPGHAIKVLVLTAEPGQRTLGLALDQDPEVEGALLALDPRDGAIRAMVGGYSFERSKFNRAVQAKRQPGSAFKPFVYATAFDRGIPPTTLLDDSPVSFVTTIGGERREWAPENFDHRFRGPTTLRRGIEQSINVMAVKLIERVGVQPVIRLAHAVGIESDLRAEYALALGVSEVTLLEMVSAYGVFANHGVRAEPFAIRRVTDNQGRVLEQHFPDPQQVLRPETAYVLTSVLKGVVERGTGSRARVLGRPMAGKTGTTQEAGDVWFIGYAPNLAAGVWVGYDARRSLGPHETSAHLAVPIWIRFAERAFADLPVEDFPIPENVVSLPVNLQTGRPARPGEPGTILEFFIKGTEPSPVLAGGEVVPAALPKSDR